MKIIIEEFTRSSKDNYRLLLQKGVKPNIGTVFRTEGSGEDAFVVVKNNFRYTYIETLNNRMPSIGIIYESKDNT